MEPRERRCWACHWEEADDLIKTINFYHCIFPSCPRPCPRDFKKLIIERGLLELKTQNAQKSDISVILGETIREMLGIKLSSKPTDVIWY